MHDDGDEMVTTMAELCRERDELAALTISSDPELAEAVALCRRLRAEQPGLVVEMDEPALWLMVHDRFTDDRVRPLLPLFPWDTWLSRGLDEDVRDSMDPAETARLDQARAELQDEIRKAMRRLLTEAWRARGREVCWPVEIALPFRRALVEGECLRFDLAMVDDDRLEGEVFGEAIETLSRSLDGMAAAVLGRWNLL